MTTVGLISGGEHPHLILNAMSINNLGQITGRARISSTEFEAFIATPARRR
jgi:hypothetical protein